LLARRASKVISLRAAGGTFSNQEDPILIWLKPVAVDKE
jgi:hypothetical protein